MHGGTTQGTSSSQSNTKDCKTHNPTDSPKKGKQWEEDENSDDDEAPPPPPPPPPPILEASSKKVVHKTDVELTLSNT